MANKLYMRERETGFCACISPVVLMNQRGWDLVSINDETGEYETLPAPMNEHEARRWADYAIDQNVTGVEKWRLDREAAALAAKASADAEAAMIAALSPEERVAMGLELPTETVVTETATKATETVVTDPVPPPVATEAQPVAATEVPPVEEQTVQLEQPPAEAPTPAAPEPYTLDNLVARLESFKDDKAGLMALAEKAGVKLDGRKSFENMAADLANAAAADQAVLDGLNA